MERCVTAAGGLLGGGECTLCITDNWKKYFDQGVHNLVVVVVVEGF